MVSATRQSDGRSGFRLYRGIKKQGEGVPMHAHDEAQLTFAASGMIQVHTATGRWLVPSRLAVWAPAGVPHRVDVLSDAELWMIYWQPATAHDWAPSAALDRAFALRVTPLLLALLHAAFRTDVTQVKAELIVKLVLQDLTETLDAPTFLPMPSSLAGRRVADMAFADSRNRLDVGELASRAATSVRTVSRVFPAETGLTFKAWRQRARIVRAIDRLSAGDAIARVSVDAGYASTAAFSFAFRQVTRMTPTEFLDSRRLA